MGSWLDAAEDERKRGSPAGQQSEAGAHGARTARPFGKAKLRAKSNHLQVTMGGDRLNATSPVHEHIPRTKSVPQMTPQCCANHLPKSVL